MLAISCVEISAQDIVNDGLQRYRRNAIATMMVLHPEDEFGKDIKDAYLEIPTPDKYDNHDIGIKVLDNSWFTGVQRNKDGLYKAVYGKNLSKSEIEKNGLALERFFNQNNIGMFMVAKWFNLTSDGSDEFDYSTATFNTNLIQERGLYDATALDVEMARHTIRGEDMLADAGEELISQTFIIVNDMTYVTAEQKAEAAKAALSVLGSITDAFLGGHSGRDMANMAGAIADSFTGFKVRNHSYLFQLQWNDSIAALFYKNYYTETPDEEKIKAFERNDSLFKVKYVAHEYEYDENSVLKGKYDRHDLVKINCTRSQDKNIAQLQVKYEDFKLKTPIYKVERNDKGKVLYYAAKVGMKEGITPKSKFQVVQRIIDPKTNKSRYKYVATLKPIKGKIWDNRYMATEEREKGSELDATQFKKSGGGEIYEGMLIIEGKYRKVEQ